MAKQNLKKSYCDIELFKLPLMFYTVTLSHMLDRVPQDLVGPYNSLSFATPHIHSAVAMLL